MLVSRGNRIAPCVGLAIGDGGDLFHGEAFYGVQDEGCAILRIRTQKRDLQQRDPFIRFLGIL